MKNIPEELRITSSLDGSEEPSLFMRADSRNPAPLIVCLHTWSSDRWNQVESVAPRAKELGCHLLLPEFRGPNLSSNPRAPEACASPQAMQDIVDAVDYVGQYGCINKARIFLLGGSGGGQMSLMMAGYRPEIWALVYASCSITDLVAWHSENRNYAPHTEACCGGPPNSPERKAEYLRRSPISYADRIARARVYIAHGKHDLAVPFTHSLNLYRRITEINPEARIYLEIFDGAHELRYNRAFSVFSRTLKTATTARVLSG
ncbi:MAG: alpha/beta fold hydrolase [Candidatus Omnitrophota bacterium]